MNFCIFAFILRIFQIIRKAGAVLAMLESMKWIVIIFRCADTSASQERIRNSIVLNRAYGSILWMQKHWQSVNQ